MSRIVMVCHQCKKTDCFKQYSQEYRDFFLVHSSHRMIGFNPDSKEGRKHAIKAGVSESVVGYYSG